MQHFIHILAEQFGFRPAQHLLSRRIYERYLPCDIKGIHPFAQT